MPNILLLEDDLTLAMHYRDWLEQLGHTVFHEVNCETAKLSLDESTIDLIVTDIILRDSSGEPMPNGGLTLISHARLNLRPYPKILAITGTDPRISLLRHAESLGIDGKLMKPLSFEKLTEEVHRVLASVSRTDNSTDSGA